jgi:hypothetical protein
MDFVSSQAILAFITNLKYTVEKIYENKSRKIKSHGSCGRVPWLFGRGSSCHGYCGQPINE